MNKVAMNNLDSLVEIIFWVDAASEEINSTDVVTVSSLFLVGLPEDIDEHARIVGGRRIGRSSCRKT